MKKIAFLSICILALILLGLSDMRLQKKRITDISEDTRIVQEDVKNISKDTKAVPEATETVPVSAGTAEEQTIRVLLKNNNFESEYHNSLQVTSNNGFTISDGNNTWQIKSGETKEFDPQSNEFAESSVLFLQSSDGKIFLPELIRERSSKEYEGEIEIRKTQQGLLVINILPLEKYLCGVVPSEMPSSYPQEALKAQAVCARTYSLQQIQEGRAAEFFADVDDSVSYQVYNNQDRAESTDRAVKETAGCILAGKDGLEEALYYSTSCGLDTNMDLSGEAVFAAFISESNIRAYEAGEPWYRWETYLSLESWEDVGAIEVRDRLPNGRAEEICVTDRTGNEELIEGEYNIRRFLAGGMQTIVLQDEEEISDMNLLPSAFFMLEPLYEEGSLTGYKVRGGGYGHGKGMSQNGAKYMAGEGMDYVEILEEYYPEADVRDMADYLAKNVHAW
ncbi:MAG: SpoIID/LytB domain-containing protein [Eubacteriales bacterium]|nr:SpoIID/LytB domain-containing protein [Eubacteriales bacterium]